MHRHVLGSSLVLLLACTVGDAGGSSFSAGYSAGEGESTSATDGTDSAAATASDAGGSGGGSGDGASIGSTSSEASSAGDSDGGHGSTGADASSDASSGAATDDGESSGTGTPNDLDDGILDIVVTAHDDCTFTTVPTSITVPEGTEFTVNWISAASSIEFDIAKIDPFNQVPIVIGMAPGTAYHDEVRSWCGALFTGTFDFRVTSCYDPQYIPVDCGG